MRWVISILFIVLFQWYAFQAIKTITNERSILVTYWFIVIAILGNILWHTLFFDRSGGFTHSLSYSIGFLLSLLLFQGTINLYFMFYTELATWVNFKVFGIFIINLFFIVIMFIYLFQQGKVDLEEKT